MKGTVLTADMDAEEFNRAVTALRVFLYDKLIMPVGTSELETKEVVDEIFSRHLLLLQDKESRGAA